MDWSGVGQGLSQGIPNVLGLQAIQTGQQNQAVQKQQMDLQAIQLREAQKKEEFLNTPIDLSYFEPMKKTQPELYQQFYDRAKSLKLIENIGGKEIIRERGKQNLFESMHTDFDFSMQALKNSDLGLNRQEQRLTEDLADLKAKVKVDKRGDPIPDDKLSGEIAAKTKELQSIKEQRKNILFTTDETVKRQAALEENKAEDARILQTQKDAAAMAREEVKVGQEKDAKFREFETVKPEWKGKKGTPEYGKAFTQYQKDTLSTKTQIGVNIKGAAEDKPMSANDRKVVDNLKAGLASGKMAPSQLNTAIQRMGGGKSAGKIRSTVVSEFLEEGGDMAKAEANFKGITSPGAISAGQLAKATTPLIADMKGLIANLPKEVRGLGPLNVLATEGKRTLAKYAGNENVVAFESMRNKLIEETERLLTSVGAMADTRVIRNLENLRNGYNTKQMESSLAVLDDVINRRLKAVQSPLYPSGGAGRPTPTF